MTNPKVPTPIVDKNGKQTTVHRSADKPAGVGRSIPGVVHGVAKNSPLDKLQRAMKRAGLPKDSGKLSIIVRALGSGTVATAGDRYDSFVRLVGTTYGLDQHKAKAAADGIYTAVGMADGIKQVSHSEVLHAAANKKLVANHKVRFPRQGSEHVVAAPAATDPSQVNESIETIAEKQPELIDAVAALASIDPEKRTTLGSINALFAATDKDTLEAIKEGLEYHGIDAPVSDLYALYHVATIDGISVEARDKAFDMVLGVNVSVVETLNKKLSSI